MMRSDTNFMLFEHTYKALVIGSTGAIGNAFVNAFKSDTNCIHVELVSRSGNTNFDLLNLDAIQAQAALSQESGPYDVIIDATGALSMDGVGPEKSLSSIRPETLISNFQINAIGPVLVIKHFAPLLGTGSSIYAKLSARVGSISDNKKGGWYGYRAAKAALNMLLQTSAIELQRKNPKLRVVALQPGTVKSNLSHEYASSVRNLLEPSESVAGMLRALKSLEAKNGAHFLDFKGQSIDW